MHGVMNSMLHCCLEQKQLLHIPLKKKQVFQVYRTTEVTFLSTNKIHLQVVVGYIVKAWPLVVSCSATKSLNWEEVTVWVARDSIQQILCIAFPRWISVHLASRSFSTAWELQLLLAIQSTLCISINI